MKSASKCADCQIPGVNVKLTPVFTTPQKRNNNMTLEIRLNIRFQKR
jgi:hypothetical protein